MILEGELVRLRPATSEDLPAYVRWYTDPEFRHYVGAGVNVPAALESPPPGQINFSAETKAGRLIGLLFVTGIRTVNRNCELGEVAIGEKDCWGKGYGTEMVKLALRFCFRELGMHQAHIRTAEFNERARRCYAKIFPHQQMHRQWVWEGDRFWDEIYFDITEEEVRADEQA